MINYVISLVGFVVILTTINALRVFGLHSDNMVIRILYTGDEDGGISRTIAFLQQQH